MDRSLGQALLSVDGYWQVNKKLTQTIGLVEALMVGYLVSVDSYNNSEDGWFHRTMEQREADLGIKEKQQTRIIKDLVELGVLETERQGMPARQWFRINYDKIAEIISQSRHDVKTSPDANSQSRHHIETSPDIISGHSYKNKTQEEIKHTSRVRGKSPPNKYGKLGTSPLRFFQRHLPSPMYEDKELRQALRDWFDHRNGIRKPVSAFSQQGLAKKINKLLKQLGTDPKKWVAAIDHSISKNWVDIYPDPAAGGNGHEHKHPRHNYEKGDLDYWYNLRAGEAGPGIIRRRDRVH
jgi:hypothetical protein